MKKILLLLVSSLLIACMAGSAMAQNSYLVDSSGVQAANPVEVLKGDYTTFGIHIYELDNSEFGTYPYRVTVTQINPATGLYSDPAPEAEIKATLLKGSISIDSNPITDLDVVQVDVFDAAPLDKTYKVTLYVGENEESQIVSASKVVSSIPEFPTVALPVAGIIGLLFIFGRKKEGL